MNEEGVRPGGGALRPPGKEGRVSAEEQNREERQEEPENEPGSGPAAETGGGQVVEVRAGESIEPCDGLLDDGGEGGGRAGSEAGLSAGPDGGLEDAGADEGGWAAGTAPAAGARLKGILESLIFCSESPLSLERMVSLVEGADRREVRRAVEELVLEYRDRQGGLEIVEVAGGFQVRTRPEFAAWVAKLRQQKPARLSRAALEVVAIVAYRQPVTRAEIEAIRGVDCAAAIGSLLEKRLIRIVGRKEVPGRPILYGTTQEFLELFGLKNLKSLPTLREIEGMFQEARPEERQPGLEAVSEPSEAAAEGRVAATPPEADAGTAGSGGGEKGVSAPAQGEADAPFWESEEEAEQDERDPGERETLDDVALRQAMDDVLRKTKVRFLRYEDVFPKEPEAEGEGEPEGEATGAPGSPDGVGAPPGKTPGGEGSTGNDG